MWYILAIAVALGAIIYIWRRSDGDIDNDPDTRMPKNEKQLRRIVRELSAVIFEDKGTEFVVGFQGGTFTLHYLSFIDSFEVMFPDFESFSCEDLPSALIAANNIHERYNLWRCSMHLNHVGTKENPWDATLSSYVSIADEKNASRNLYPHMMSAFQVARDFSEMFFKEKQTNNYSLDRLKEADYRNKIEMAKNAWSTLPHGNATPEPEDEVNGGPLTIRRMLSMWRDVDFGAIESLRILAEGKSEKLTEAEKILPFDIYNYILNHHTEAWTNDFALQLTAENEGLLILLRRADGCTDKTLFYKMTVYRTGLRANFDIDALFYSSRIEIRLTPLDNDLWETKYMVEEAVAKNERGDFNKLTEMEKAIVAMATDSLQAHMYWGKRYYNAGCLYQSLEHFRYVYRHCRNNWYKLNERGRDYYFEVCYYIGFVYLDMNMMEKAHYFLEIASHTQNIPFVEEFVNCLCNMKDPHALGYISNCASQVNRLLGDKGPDDSLLAFHDFLERRYVYAQIDMHLYDEARQHLNQMIERGNSVDFAKKELAYLDNLVQSTTDDVPNETNEDSIQ